MADISRVCVLCWLFVGWLRVVLICFVMCVCVCGAVLRVGVVVGLRVCVLFSGWCWFVLHGLLFLLARFVVVVVVVAVVVVVVWCVCVSYARLIISQRVVEQTHGRPFQTNNI